MLDLNFFENFFNKKFYIWKILFTFASVKKSKMENLILNLKSVAETQLDLMIFYDAI